MTANDAQARIDARFQKVNETTSSVGRCYRSWTELWETVDGSPANAEDAAAFEALPRGQGHSVTAVGAAIALRCVCDSGD